METVDPPATSATPPPEPSQRAETSSFDVSVAARYLLATLSAAAGVIHLAMVPMHAGDSTIDAVLFGAAGWAQIALAVALIARPVRLVVEATVVLNVAIAVGWAVSRTRGLPWGAHAGIAESSSFIDLLCTGLEIALVVGAAITLSRPRLLEKVSTTPALVVGSIVPLAILLVTTTALAAPETRTHGHGGGETAAGHTHTAGEAADGHTHTAGEAADGHDHPATAVNAADRCDWQFNTTEYWSRNPPVADGHAHSHSEGQAAGGGASGGAGTGVGNQHGMQGWTPMTDKAQCDKLANEIKLAEATAAKYPTPTEAQAAGCVRVTTYVTGIASHWACFKNWDGKIEIDKPEMLLYGGNSMTAPIVGLSYYLAQKDQPTPDQNFTGAQMPYHVHEGLCVKGALVIGGDGGSKEECEKRGGKIQGRSGFMGHYWLNTCSSPDGVFSADNPRLDWEVAQYNDDPANAADPAKLQKNPCAGSKLKDNGTFGPPPGTVSAPPQKTESASGS